MDISNYISSGLLEAYVAGALPVDEAADVAKAIKQYPDVEAEVAAIEATFLELAKANAKQPPTDLSESIWSKINHSTSEILVDEQGGLIKDASTQIIGLSPKVNTTKFSFARAAVWAALVASAALNLFLYNGKKAASESSIAAQQKLDTAVEGNKLLALALAKYETEVGMMANPDMHPVVMRTMQKNQPMVAVIYYNETGTEAYVSLQKIPVAPDGMQYQLWAIADGKPVDLGVIRNDMVQQQGIEKLNKSVPSGQAFAISLEKEGGSPAPTMDRIYVMGKVAS